MYKFSIIGCSIYFLIGLFRFLMIKGMIVLLVMLNVEMMFIVVVLVFLFILLNGGLCILFLLSIFIIIFIV